MDDIIILIVRKGLNKRLISDIIVNDSEMQSDLMDLLVMISYDDGFTREYVDSSMSSWSYPNDYSITGIKWNDEIEDVADYVLNKFDDIDEAKSYIGTRDYYKDLLLDEYITYSLDIHAMM